MNKNNLFPVWSEDNACPVDYCLKVMETAVKESDSNCVFSREGCKQIYVIISDIVKGNPQRGDYELLKDILAVSKENTTCDMTKEAFQICADMMETYEDEWDKHIIRKACTNLVCPASFSLYIDPVICIGCGACKECFGADSIEGKNGMIHILKKYDSKDVKKLIGICDKNAIKKAGPIKPKLPTELVPVGSFTDSNSGSARRKRRRRV